MPRKKQETDVVVRDKVNQQIIEMFPALKPDSGLAVAQAINGESFDVNTLVKVKTPAQGSTTWLYDDGFGNEISSKEISGALVVYDKRAVLWPSEGEAVEGAKPVLISNDLVWARKVGDDLGDLKQELLDEVYDEELNRYDIRSSEQGGAFYYSEFGSSKTGGPRMKQQRILGVLPPGEELPLLITVQPGSLGNIVPIMQRLTFAHFRATVKLTLEESKSASGVKYSQIRMAVTNAKDPLPIEIGEMLRKMYTAPLSNRTPVV